MNLKAITANWKTTSAGLLAIIGGCTTLYFNRGALTETVVLSAATAIVSGIGLVLGRDADKSSEQSRGVEK